MTTLRIRPSLVHETISYLQAGGAQGYEAAVLWLGTNNDVDEVYLPAQTAEKDFFYISPQSMRDLMTHLRLAKKYIIAQVHSHPHEAFHSAADDRWSIVRHEGALSLVIPQFALHTTLDSFTRDVAVFQLTRDDKWLPVEAARHVDIAG